MSIRAVAAAAVLALSTLSPAFAQDGTWRDFMPPQRRNASLVFDTTRDRYVLFGGSERELLRNEVFELPADSTHWRQLSPIGNVPPQREGAASAFDDLHGRIWIYGGKAGSGVSSGLYGLDTDPDEWLFLNTGNTAPSGKVYSSMVYDQARDRLVQFGGLIVTLNSPSSSDVSWIAPYSDNPKWNKLSVSGTPPLPRWGAIVALDRVRDRLVVLGGRNRDSVLTDAWELKFTPFPIWNRLITVGAVPPVRDGAIGALDAANDRIVTFGGADGGGTPNHDTWIFHLQGLNAWERVGPDANVPDALVGACAVIDSARGRIVVHGGGRPQVQTASYASNETRALDVHGVPAWGRITPPGETPRPRYGTGTAYDLPHDAFWIFGGLSSKNGANDFSNELWRGSLADPGTWTLVQPDGPAPEGRHEPSLGYDAHANRLYVFGGWNGTTYFGDTWTLDAAEPAWRPIATAGGPKARRAQATAWDASRRALFVFGGVDDDSTFADAWELATDGSIAWRRIDAEGDAPAPRGWASAVYDPIGDRMIVYGGLIDGVTQGDAWALSLGGTPRWTLLKAASDAKDTRARHAAAYDPLRRRMLVWGGFTDDGTIRSSASGTWALALDGDPAWSRLSTSGVQPYEATAPAMVYDLRHDRLVMYGGSELFDDLLPDLHALEFGGTPGAAWLTGARVDGGSVRLGWQTIADPGTAVTIERRVDAYGDEPQPFDPPIGAWTTLAATTVAADGGVTWTDSHVGGGGSYSYRLIVGGQPSEVISVVIPAIPKFALENVLPSPTTGPLVMAIRSTGAAPVWATLYDANGRRVLVRELGVLPAGLQSVPLELPAGRRAGIYFLRVSQGGSAATRKIVVL